jgi:hypothetical protein
MKAFDRASAPRRVGIPSSFASLRISAGDSDAASAPQLRYAQDDIQKKRKEAAVRMTAHLFDVPR